VRFRTLYRSLFLTSLLFLFLDFIVTQVGFTRFPWLARYVNPHLACLTVLVTLLCLVLAYRGCQCYLARMPYAADLGDVWRYLMRKGPISKSDLAVFASIALYLAFIHMHLMGLLSWLRLLL